MKDDEGVVVSARGDVVGRASAELMPFIVRTLEAHNLSLKAIGEWRVGLGPGSFSGIRSGAALIAGVARGTGARISGVASSLAMAAAVDGETVEVFHDGRRGEVIWSPYARSGTRGELVQKVEPKAIAVADLPEDLSQSTLVMLADDPALPLVEARLGGVERLEVVPADRLLDCPQGGPLEPVYVRPAVFVSPKKIRNG